MAEVTWTEEQKNAIIKKGSHILVAAAAGSGKTAVLVERMIRKIIDDKIDIDKILIVTFTNAAASEMRERILDAIYKKIEEDPEDSHLQRQLILLNKSNISTIHAFCLEVIKNDFYELDLPANFRIGDTAEIELLKQEALEDLFEEKYIDQDRPFLKLIDTYTTYRDDQNLKELILKIYEYIMASPFPEIWMQEKVEMFQRKENDDFGNSIWGSILLAQVYDMLEEYILKLKQIQTQMRKFEELDKFTRVIAEDIENLKCFQENMQNWDKAYEKYHAINFTKWPIDKKITIELKQQAKDIRDSVKKDFTTKIGKILLYPSKEAYCDIYDMHDILQAIQNMVVAFKQRFKASKREKNIIDFHDIEHLALNILIKRNDEGIVSKTEVAKKIEDKFEEIAIDEYQDSNLVQEYILNSIAKTNNIFMVGDVKQSIYKFRQARPDLFLEKYKNYSIHPKEGENRKIQLFKNFRSRDVILDITNLIFQDIMSEKLGEIDYNQEEYLNLGANYETIKQEKFSSKSELHILDLEEQEQNVWKEDTEEIQEEEEQEPIEDCVLEARFIAKKIQEMVEGGYLVADKKQGIRKAQYRDFAILLRATSILAPIYEKEVEKLEIPVFSDTSTQYLESIEIETIMAILKIIDNPMQDIPLVTVLRSPIGGFTDNELVEIRLADKNSNFYEALLKAQIQAEEGLRQKIRRLVTQLEEWKEQEKQGSTSELIWKIYMDTGYLHYVSLMPNGELRQANLKMLFERAKQYESASFKGLFYFIQFIDKLKLSSGDLGSAKLIGENENVVRIMSIHKSKGLEFPIVFLSSTGKGFNLKDLNEPILLHEEMGFGPKYIDSEKHIEYNTLAKEAIRIKVKNETISEEMRVLYVALTRSKEKLIITGLQKNAQEKLREKEELLELYDEKKENNKINDKLVKKYKTYLDWIELVYLNHKKEIGNILEVQIHHKNEIEMEKKEEVQEDILKKFQESIPQEEKETHTMIESLLEWKYPYIDSIVIAAKTSVTKMKELEKGEMNEKENTVIKYEATSITEQPNFLKTEEKETITNAQKGTLMHLVIQKLEEKKEYTKQEVLELLQDLVDRQIITSLEKEAVSVQKLLGYIRSDLWKELKQAKEIRKEQPFYISVSADEVYQTQSKESILVQGIMDVYYINQQDELILVDYKTDYVEIGKEQELVEKYKKQLDLYQKALEQATGRKVAKKQIYSVMLEKTIDIEK